jgi:uncharacterized protein with beta-barrel porin domain
VHSDAHGSDSLSGDQVGVGNVQLTAYGTKRFDAAFVNGMLGVGYNMFDQSRNIAFLNQTASAKYSGMQYVGKIDGGYDFAADNNVTLTPLAGFQAVRTVNNGYNESGAGAADVSVGHMGYNSYTTDLGGKVTTQVATDWGDMTPELKLTWAHDLMHGPISTSATMGGVNFTTATPRVAPDGAEIGLAVTLKQTDNIDIRVEYDGDLRDGYQSHSGLVKLNWSY